jgi:hypothetical protein
MHTTTPFVMGQVEASDGWNELVCNLRSHLIRPVDPCIFYIRDGPVFEGVGHSA